MPCGMSSAQPPGFAAVELAVRRLLSVFGTPLKTFQFIVTLRVPSHCQSKLSYDVPLKTPRRCQTDIHRVRV